MIDKPLPAITVTDLKAQVTNQAAESRALEYKAEFYGKSDEDKRELLKDASSFGNTVGGDIVFGVAAKDGIPVSVDGIEKGVLDSEILRLTETLNRGLEPRMAFQFSNPIEVSPDKACIVLRIPDSYSKPHRVVYAGKFGEFWGRHTRGKFSMDTTQLREAFTFAAGVEERMKRFIEDRINMILNKQAPVVLHRDGWIVLHVIPIQTFYTATRLVLTRPDLLPFAPLGASGWDTRPNVDGFISCRDVHQREPQRGYTQVFRNGILELVDADYVVQSEGEKGCRQIAFEVSLMNKLPQMLSKLRSLGITSPFWLFATIIGGLGARLALEYEYGYTSGFDRDWINLPVVVIEDINQAPPAMLRELFELIWNAAGYDRCHSIDNDGNHVHFRS